MTTNTLAAVLEYYDHREEILLEALRVEPWSPRTEDIAIALDIIAHARAAEIAESEDHPDPNWWF